MVYYILVKEKWVNIIFLDWDIFNNIVLDYIYINKVIKLWNIKSI